jgi:hypothetical protein
MSGGKAPYITVALYAGMRSASHSGHFTPTGAPIHIRQEAGWELGLV